ncbi:MAG TPA: type II toxin-antitoxin system VapC family toxin [Candidatus Nanoarchaeia archaeon]|nr:type II toxin-antitoxin system VapC family toxin [Candidatus Nanoarchaeia archaeon]
MEEAHILIDTNIFIDHLRNHAPAVHFFQSIAEWENVLFSAITEVELVTGKINNDSSKKEKLMHFLNRWIKITVDNPLAEIAGDISRQYGLSVPDAIIAASALTNQAVLITKNIKDFRNVKGLIIKSPY